MILKRITAGVLALTCILPVGILTLPHDMLPELSAIPQTALIVDDSSPQWVAPIICKLFPHLLGCEKHKSR